MSASGSGTFAERLAAARPPDPSGRVLEAAAVRVLARVAVLEGLPPVRAQRAQRRLRALVAAALPAMLLLAGLLLAGLLLAGLLALGGSAPQRAPREAGPTAYDCPEAWTDTLREALSGQRVARTCLRRAGPVGRELLWRAAESGQAPALALLRSFGRLSSAAEAERAGALALAEPLRAEALELLVAEPGAWGVEQLLSLLVSRAEVEREVVAALERVAQRGGRDEALRALLAGAAAGRAEAARAAVRLGPASTADRLLVLLPPALLESDALAQALAQARPTFAARVLRRAEGGDEAALTWAAAAGLSECVPLLLSLAVGEEPERSEQALARLARLGGVQACLALARATEAPAGQAARQHLAALGAHACDALARHAILAPRDRAAALWALSCAGQAGLLELPRLSVSPVLRPDVLCVLERSPTPGAAGVLLAMAEGSDSALPVVAALSRRLAAGAADAGPALLALSRSGPRRAALEGLFDAGEPGARFLALAAGDDQLAAEARPLWERAEERSAAARPGVRPRPQRLPRVF